ncbi:hypothetical protein DMUE_1198 [Dictyocoela muelleri]|nr:hypothetical protein DMUE_1198 [Dictyocoela muelleri]
MEEFFNISTKNVDLLVLPEAPEIEEKTKTINGFCDSQTRHQIVIPANKNYNDFKIGNCDDMKFDFELDTFQKIAISAIDRDESVLVSAHTSSGKTVVAEYSIAKAIKNKQRVVYTSPIKALSNQKFRDLSEKFSDVGLITGDVTLNPNSTCLVMTTEILRNMLYRGNEVIKEVHWVIFDEIHYMRDRDRGVVWEETIILMPKDVKMIFLSATIPNAIEFAQWITAVHSQTVHVVYTEKRPIPLTHYFTAVGGHGLVKVKDSTSDFNLRAFSSLQKEISRRRVNEEDIKNVLDAMVAKECLPIIIFSFARRECEKFAMALNSEDFTNEDEKDMIETIFNNALSSLRKEDRSIPLIQHILPMLKRGVGIHHSGLLPIIKEIVEILFQEGLLKVLFATETFSIGLNMPARSVVFTSLTKFDGQSMRLISSGEYTQMSGRAGRRGIDTQGIVVSILAETMNSMEVKEIFCGEADILDSAFHLTYNMIINLLRVEGLEPLFLLERSFFHFQSGKKLKKLKQDVKKTYEQLSNEHPENFKSLFEKLEKLKTLKIERNKTRDKNILEFMEKGRVIDVLIDRQGPLMVVKNCVIDKITRNEIEVFMELNGVVKKKIKLSEVDCIYDVRVKMNRSVFFKKYPPLERDPKKIRELIDQIKNENGFKGFEICYLCGNKFSKDCLTATCVSKTNWSDLESSKKEPFYFFRHEYLRKNYHAMTVELSKLSEIHHMSECKKMIQVLRRMDYYDTSVTVKGRVACEISTGDELILTEMMFNGDFVKLPVDELVPLLSCVVFQEWNDDCVVSETNLKNYELIRMAAKKICETMTECNIEMNVEAYMKKYSYGLMDIIKMWVCGSTFYEICQCTSVFEGSIIRCLKRLEELLRQLCSAARAIGNTDLENLFGLGITKIKRDIVFANSLYL